MSSNTYISGALDGSAGSHLTETVLSFQGKLRPFEAWHLRKKFSVMERLFRSYLFPGAKLADMACGSGDGALLASLCQPDCDVWGLDIDAKSLAIAQRRLPMGRFVEGDFLNPGLPAGYFDVVHEFGATFFTSRWDLLAKAYFSLLRDGGVLLWELPQKWSTAHIAYMLSLAPKITAADTKLKRIFRSFSPWKYTYESDAEVMRALQMTGCDYEVLEMAGIWHFYCRGMLCAFLNYAWRFFGDPMFDRIEALTRRVWPRYSGYYLVVRKNGPNIV